MSKKKVADKPQGNIGGGNWQTRFTEASKQRGAKAASAKEDKPAKAESPAEKTIEPATEAPPKAAKPPKPAKAAKPSTTKKTKPNE